MKIQTIAKYIDQPIIINKLNKQIPKLLICSGSLMVLNDVRKNKDDKNRLLKDTIISSAIISTTLIGIKKCNLIDIKPLSQIVKNQTNAIEKYKKLSNPTDEILLSILNKSKRNHLSLDEISVLFEKLKNDSNKTFLFKTLFSEGNNLTSKEIFSEIKRLSILGAIPVLSGIAGGIAADTLTGTRSKKGTSNKIKEGFYQYFANIFLCNVGAGAALYGLEKLNQKGIIKTLTPAKRLTAILSGITLTGIIGGSYIANFLSKKIINPLFKQKKESGIYSERKPEALDIALHSDDIATAGVLSGLKWVEPMLPVMYFLSGFRAGTGYRNVNN